MAGGSGSESMLPMLLMQQAGRIDPLYYGQGYVDDITNTIMQTMAASSSGSQAPVQAGGQQAAGGQVVRRQGLPSGEAYDQTLMDALNYVNSIAGYMEPQHYDYYTDSSGNKKRKQRTDATDADLEFYDQHEKGAAALEQLKAWNKKRSGSTSSTSGGSSLLTGDLSSLFAGLIGGGQ